jgi:hypothetical protein
LWCTGISVSLPPFSLNRIIDRFPVWKSRASPTEPPVSSQWLSGLSPTAVTTLLEPLSSTGLAAGSFAVRSQSRVAPAALLVTSQWLSGLIAEL